MTFARFLNAVLNREHDLQSLSFRQMAARCCQDALRASKTKEEVYHVLRLMVRLSDDIGKCMDELLRNPWFYNPIFKCQVSRNTAYKFLFVILFDFVNNAELIHFRIFSMP